MNMDQTRLAYLFRRYYSQVATEEERQELMTLISRDEHVAEVKALMDEAWETGKADTPLFSPGQSEDMLRRILQQGEEKAGKSFPLHRRQPVRWIRSAAAVALLAVLSAGGYAWYAAYQQRHAGTSDNAAQVSNDIAPGGNKAVLTLANGTSIVLDSSRNGVLAQQGNAQVLKLGSGQLAYETKSPTPETGSGASLNTLTTPRGGEYEITLPDGTRVWLNAASSLRFPTAFAAGERTVELSGEAYFEVAEDKSRPFNVKVNNMQVRVLGTHFNIMAYNDEASVKTTLLEGAVKISNAGTDALLKPGQQANIDKGRQNIRVQEADLEEVMAWKEGLFHFDGDDLPSIMRKIGRWYDVEISYDGAIPDSHFTGVISRNNKLSQVLEVLELSGVHFTVEGRVIRVAHQSK